MSDIRFTRDLRESIERLVTNDGVIGDGGGIDDFAPTFSGGWSAALAAVLDIMGPAGRHDIEDGEIDRLRAEVANLRACLVSLGPPPAMRLAMYRAGAIAAGQVMAVESTAQQVLASERAPEVAR